MPVRKTTKDVSLSGKYIDGTERQANIDQHGALKVVTLNYKPGRNILMKGHKFTAKAAFGPDSPRTTEHVWELPYGINLLGGNFKMKNATDGDKINISVIYPQEDGSEIEVNFVEDLFIFQGEEYSLNNDTSFELPAATKIKVYYTNTAEKTKEIFYSYTLYR